MNLTQEFDKTWVAALCLGPFVKLVGSRAGPKQCRKTADRLVTEVLWTRLYEEQCVS